MPPKLTPNYPTVADDAATAQPRSAADHCAAAEALFAHARAIHPQLSSRAADQDEYQRCLDWASMHLRLAETITAGAGLVLTHRQLLANDVRLHNTYVGHETQQWTEYLGEHHDKTRASA